jgi:AraC family transcriptional regulator of adaptative response/methylated-DNA-[protein]-cysteine methyltransferase
MGVYYWKGFYQTFFSKRPVRRTIMTKIDHPQLNRDYRRIEQAIKFLEQNFRHQPDLKEIANHIGLSEFHFQRLFTRWAGITPKQFVKFLTKEYAKNLLKKTYNVLDASYEAGLSGPGRLHDLFVTCEAVTPGEYKQMGEGLTIRYGFHPTPFGKCFIAVTERGICFLAFIKDDNDRDLPNSFKRDWQKAILREEPDYTRSYRDQIFNRLDSNSRPIRLVLKGTNFQIKVWEALLKIPFGTVATYTKIAEQIKKPGASRAVANAIGNNPVALVVPCHRVLRKSGELGGYRYGLARKKAILGWEAAQRV